MMWQNWIQILGLVGNRVAEVLVASSIQALKGEWYVVSPKDEKSQALILFKKTYEFSIHSYQTPTTLFF